MHTHAQNDALTTQKRNTTAGVLQCIWMLSEIFRYTLITRPATEVAGYTRAKSAYADWVLAIRVLADSGIL